MRTLFLGDIMGRSGRQAVLSALTPLRRELRLDFIVVNGENAAGGRGITPDLADELFRAGVDVLTGGNHSWDKREIVPYISQTPRLLRPLNLSGKTPGAGFVVITPAGGGKQLLVVNVMTRLFMEASDSPFVVLDRLLNEYQLGRDAAAILVDCHGEATSEKVALAHYLDGRVTAVLGTHTHIPTCDERILAGGTAFQSDVGMCGCYDSVIGLEKQAAVARFVAPVRAPFAEAAHGLATLCGAVIESDEATGTAQSIERLSLGGVLPQAYPAGLALRLPTA